MIIHSEWFRKIRLYRLYTCIKSIKTRKYVSATLMYRLANIGKHSLFQVQSSVYQYYWVHTAHRILPVKRCYHVVTMYQVHWSMKYWAQTYRTFASDEISSCCKYEPSFKKTWVIFIKKKLQCKGQPEVEPCNFN